MKITRNNYEEFFLDFTEGKLESGLQREFERFLEENPDLRLELGEFENVTVEDNLNNRFDRKSSLKKDFSPVGEIDEFNYEDFLIGKVENDLNPREAENLRQFISRNPFAVREQELYRKTILHPDPKILFPRKSDLKKYVVIPIFRRQTVAALAIAASILMLLYLNFNRDILFPGTGSEMAQEDISSVSSSEANPENNKSAESGSGNLKENLAQTVSGKESRKKKWNGKTDSAVGEISEKKKENLVADSLPSNDIGSLQDAGHAVAGKTQEPVAEEMAPVEINGDERVADYTDEEVPSAEKNMGRAAGQKTGQDDESFTFREFLAYSFRKNVLKENVPKRKKEAKVHPVDFASAAVRGASRLFGSKVQLKKQYRDNGELASVALISPQFEVSRTLHGK